MSVSTFIKSPATARIAALVLIVCLALSTLLCAQPKAFAEVPASVAKDRSVAQGVCDALWILTHRLDESGQDALTEKALEEARRSDREASEKALAAMNDTGARYAKEVAASRAAQEAAAKEALEADAANSASRERAHIADNTTPTAEILPSKSATPLAKTSGPQNLICFLGEEVRYEQGGPADSMAPDGYASTWVGSGRASDNANTYFIGHNPGIFKKVMDLAIGDKITVFDDTGASRTYYVFDTLILPNGSNYLAYEGRIAPMGETITLQTCCGDNKHVRCVMAR